ncbi:aminodeoxychorismate/anthranilate synthase component II [Streptomyces sp. NBC_00878]|uniref:anthranilate synthase component II n=1 Tax=Streptomyces sp. NBC_00878 TaxID=2975854 RepID=UPI00225528BE|nr:aminodeoxychorismate/anthranilate synthase component II [Streptomyces sp. NBC_00878]MCX4904518.1 aminodeoxychorismate/anthranilate synthase component II [Streptomyces sp. NBC_00878]
MNVLIIDAYDSFVYIIDRYVRSLGVDSQVVRSGTRTLDELAAGQPDAVILGPGPGHPAASGHVELVGRFAGEVPLLGVCLGHQAIALAYGGRIAVADHLMHGRTSTVDHDGAGIFVGAPQSMTVTRYHSLVVSEPLPAELEVTARSLDDGYVMGLRHRTLPVESVQFHPESITTSGGLDLFSNFLDTAHC